MPEDTDVHALMDGAIAVTPIYMDLSHYGAIETLTAAFDADPVQL